MKLYKKIANQSENFLHNKSKELATNFDVAVIENLHMKGMLRVLCFGKNAVDNIHNIFSIYATGTRKTACKNR